MRRNLIVLDFLLLLLCALSIWRFIGFRRERLAEQAVFLRHREFAGPMPVVLMPPPVQPAAAGTYVEVAQQLLLSTERNPTVILDVIPPKQMPAFPRAYGAMDFGGGPRVFLALRAGEPQRPYGPDSQIGEFKVLAISRAGVVFEWDGKEVAASFEQMRDTAAGSQARASQPSTARQQPAPAATPTREAAQSSAAQTIAANSGTPGRPGPGSGPSRPCAAGDTTPAGTVVEGYRRMSIDTPMGKGCYWEKVQ